MKLYVSKVLEHGVKSLAIRLRGKFCFHNIMQHAQIKCKIAHERMLAYERTLCNSLPYINNVRERVVA